MRILLNTFTSTTLDNVVRSFQKHNNGMGAWKAIISKVEGANYASELKRQGNQIIKNALFDPNKNFTFENTLISMSSPTNYTRQPKRPSRNGVKLTSS